MYSPRAYPFEISLERAKRRWLIYLKIRMRSFVPDILEILEQPSIMRRLKP